MPPGKVGELVIDVPLKRPEWNGWNGFGTETFAWAFY